MKGQRFVGTAASAALVLLLMAGLALAQAPEATPVGTAITYQGQLKSSDAPYSGTCDFRFALWDALTDGAQIGSTLTKTNVSLTGGYFTLALDFGTGRFQGDGRWLAIEVCCPAGSGTYTLLTPRQALAAAPYALALPGLWTQPNDTSPNLVGGYSGNWLASGVYGATIAGGGFSGAPNRVTDNSGTVGGGYSNQAGDDAGTVANAAKATVGGGDGNTASGAESAVGGGHGNTASGFAAAVGGGELNGAGGNMSSIGGGYGNAASANLATVGGGSGNDASGHAATIGGGLGNEASGEYSTVPGGSNNSALGDYSFAAGYRAKAAYDGSFVWADMQETDYIPLEANTFNVRAQNGASIDAANSLWGLNVDNDNGESIDAYATVSSGNSFAAVYASNSGTSPGIYARSAGTYAGYFNGQIYTTGCVGCVLIQLGQDDGAGALQLGDLAAVSGLGDPLVGTSQPILRVHRAAPGEAVIGVVQARGVRARAERDGQTIESVDLAESEIQAGDYLFLVVYGPAQVRADASSGAIAAGARLAAGGQPGHARVLRTAMVEGVTVAEAAPHVGTALEALDSGTGLISVFVTLN